MRGFGDFLFGHPGTSAIRANAILVKKVLAVMRQKAVGNVGNVSHSRVPTPGVGLP
jgi:hypothetical protein